MYFRWNTILFAQDKQFVQIRMCKRPSIILGGIVSFGLVIFKLYNRRMAGILVLVSKFFFQQCNASIFNSCLLDFLNNLDSGLAEILHVCTKWFIYTFRSDLASTNFQGFCDVVYKCITVYHIFFLFSF